MLSGLFDLEPLCRCSMNAWLHLDPVRARRNSPLFAIAPGSPARVLVSHGGRETPEFARQSTAYLAAWQHSGNAGQAVAMPDHNHFDIAVALATPGTALNGALLSMLRA